MSSAVDAKIKELKAQVDMLEKTKTLLKPADSFPKPPRPKPTTDHKKDISKSASKPISHPPAGNDQHKEKKKEKKE